MPNPPRKAIRKRISKMTIVMAKIAETITDAMNGSIQIKTPRKYVNKFSLRSLKYFNLSRFTLINFIIAKTNTIVEIHQIIAYGHIFPLKSNTIMGNIVAR